MFITGPDVIRAVTGGRVLRGARRGQATRRGRGWPTSPPRTSTSCIEDIKALLAFLPSNNLEQPPRLAPSEDPLRADPALDDFLPDSSNVPYDVRDLIAAVVDDGAFLEVSPDFAQNIVVGFARLDGYAVGIVANQPMVLAGTLDVSASEKAGRFVRTCDAFNVPIVTFVDVPGFLPGTAQEQGRDHPPRRQAALRLLRRPCPSSP